MVLSLFRYLENRNLEFFFKFQTWSPSITITVLILFCLSLQVASLVRDLRTELDRLLEKKIENPSFDLASCARGSRVIDAIVQLITTQ